ncbi:MAG TPA: RsmE family RNA methyltransferase [Methylomirabilota bacterium]|nr:RsmE family RNA methyltransferase [Methylomirabilota bacterium]
MKQPPWLLAPPDSLEVGRVVVLGAAEARHVTGALRLRAGDRVVVTDGAGRVTSGVLEATGRGEVRVALGELHLEPRPPAGPALAMGVLAGSAMDLVVQKAVELGVDRFLPVCCARSQLNLRRAVDRRDHWDRVGRQALKQCHRAWAMEVACPVSLEGLVAGATPGAGVVGHPEGEPPDRLPLDRCRLLLVGPEGGLTDDEERLLADSGWPRVRFGRHILRAETAAIAGVALLGARLDAARG